MAGYVIAQIDLKSKEGYKEYADKVPTTVKNFGGEYLVSCLLYTSDAADE